MACRDGYFSIHSMELGPPTQDNMIHFFHHDSGGLFRLDISPSGSILVINLNGCLQLFQPKGDCSGTVGKIYTPIFSFFE